MPDLDMSVPIVEIVCGAVGTLVVGAIGLLARLWRAVAESEQRDKSMVGWLRSVQASSERTADLTQQCTVSLAAALASQTAALEAMEKRLDSQHDRQRRISDRVRAIESSGNWGTNGRG